MKPFDLKAALAGAPVITRKGDPVLSIAHFPRKRNAFKVYGTIDDALYGWRETGEYFSGSSGLDLFMATVKRTVWVNLYENGYAFVFATRDIADEKSLYGRVGSKAWPLEIEE